MKKIFSIFFVFLLLLTPGLTLAALVECDVCTFQDFLGIIPKISDFIIMNIVTPAAFLFLTIGGIVLLISGGNPGLKNLGKKILLTTVIGMALAFGAWYRGSS